MKREIQVPALRDEGRFANRLIHYMVARHMCSKHDAVLKTHPWIGECIFDITDERATAPLKELAFATIEGGVFGRVAIPPFFSIPHRVVDPLLTRAFAKSIFKWQQYFSDKISKMPRKKVAIHVRRGDFRGLRDFPIVPVHVLLEGAAAQGFSIDDCFMVREECPLDSGLFPWPFQFLEDFCTLMLAENVFVYPRSSFSQLAALLGDGQIFMPYDYSPDPGKCRFERHDPANPAVFPTRNNTLV